MCKDPGLESQAHQHPGPPPSLCLPQALGQSLTHFFCLPLLRVSSTPKIRQESMPQLSLEARTATCLGVSVLLGMHVATPLSYLSPQHRCTDIVSSYLSLSLSWLLLQHEHVVHLCKVLLSYQTSRANQARELSPQ